MKKISLCLVLLCLVGVLSAYEMNTLIESPTAGILQRGEAEITTKLFRNNGVMLGTRVGLFPRFMFGVSFGGEQLVGNQKPEWQENVEFNAKFRLLDESAQYPAVAVGYDSQGHGVFHESVDRYDIKSRGFYLVASKNYFFMGNLGVHAGTNFSLETGDEDKTPNLFVGVDKTVGDVVLVMAEYDFAFNDRKDWLKQSADEHIDNLKRGFLNAGLAVYFTEYLSVRLSFYDLLQKRSDTHGSDRTLTILYNMTF